MANALIVTSAAATTDLTTLETVKGDLGVTSSDEDTYFQRQITQVSEQICGRVRLPSADDGTCSLGRESLTQTYHLKSGHKNLFLSRWLPRGWPCTVSSVTENNIALDAALWEVDPKTGIVKRKSSGQVICWPCHVDILVSYTAGWLLPNDTGRDLPVSIESAAIGWIKFNRLNKTRDPSLQSENILEGLYSYRLFAPSDTPDGCPAEVSLLLDPYVRALDIAED